MIDALRTAGFVLCDVRNPISVIACTLSRQREPAILLRDGSYLDSPEGAWSAVNLIWGQKIYTPNGLQIDDEDIVVDIGANVGVFAIYAARRTRNQVWAFEPFPQNVTCLTENVRRSKLGNVVIVSAAVGASKGPVKLFLAETNEGHLLFDRNIYGSLQDYIIVESITLGTILDQYALPRIDFLKLDCEGAEGMILGSLTSVTLAKVRKIAMEFHDNVSPMHHVEIGRLLESAGFHTWLRWDGSSPFGYLYAKRT